MKLGSIDIHNHILPGVDDGFQNPEESLEAIRRMASIGCSEIVFTPHMNPDVYPDSTESRLREVYADFVSRIPAEWGVKTHLAAEYMVVADFEDRLSKLEDLLFQPDGSLLIEMSYMFRSRNLENVIFELQMQGITPVLAHPERYTYLVGKLGTFDKLYDMGCRFQMNRRSLSGCYGSDSMKILKYIHKKGWYDHMATDLHSLAQLDAIMDMKDEEKYLKNPWWKIF